MSHLYCFLVETVSRKCMALPHLWTETCVLYQNYTETMLQCSTKGSMFCDIKVHFLGCFLRHYVAKTVSICIVFTLISESVYYISQQVLCV